jgi:hypothetical protein
MAHVCGGTEISVFLSTPETSIGTPNTSLHKCVELLISFSAVSKVSNSLIGEMKCNARLDFQPFPGPLIWKVN